MSAQQEPGSNSLTADNLEKFGKLNHSPGVPEDGALLSEAKLQSIISFLDEMEKSEQERPRSAASATQREASAEARAALRRRDAGGKGLLPPCPGGRHLLLMAFFPCGRVSSRKRSWLTWSRPRLLPRRSRAPS